jgi:predicted O-methyltransferase YrrM
MAAMRLTDADVFSIVGAFWAPDLDLFRLLLDETSRNGSGDLAELGVLLGRSAVLIGDSLGPGETFTVVDLFEETADDDANQEENQSSYHGVTQDVFESNYTRVLGSLPVVVKGLSTTIVDKAAHGTHRFVHIDASHLYEHVVADIEVARTLLRPDGVVALDDFRAEHTPGVAAAAWRAADHGGLRPFAVSPRKMYGTWGDPDPYVRRVTDWATGNGLFEETQQVLGHTLVRVGEPPHHPAKRYLPEVAWPALRWASSLGRRPRHSF